MGKRSIDDINNELKVFVNEATFISSKVLKKLIKLICKYFYVDLPMEDYLKVDIEIMENGNIIMKGDEYSSSNKPKNFDELLDRYNSFETEVKILLNKKEINFDRKRSKNDFISFLIAVFFSLLLMIIIIYSIKQILRGNIFGGVWLVFVLIPIITPKIKDRYTGALRFLKKIFRKK